MNRKLHPHKHLKLTLIGYAVIFVLMLCLCCLFPYTGDDWAWGGPIGIERLNNRFDNYSGRYVGNLIVLALTRSNILKAVVMAFCLTGIVMLVNKLTGEQKNGIFLISAVLLYMPVALLRQAVVWTSGFSNYTTSIFLTLIYIYYTRNIYSSSVPKYSLWHIIPLGLLGFVNTLIVEHITVYNVLLSLYVTVFALVRFKKAFAQHIAYLAGAVAGTLTMFSNPVYTSVLNGDDKYRTIGIGGLGEIASKAGKAYFNTVMPEGFLNNFVLNLFLAAVCIAVWYCVKSRLSKKARAIGGLSLAVIVMYASLSLMNRVSSIERTEILAYAMGGATAIYILAVCVFLIILPFWAQEKAKLLFIFGSTGCMIAPLLVVTPIGSRCFFAPYVMILLLAMELYSNIDEAVKEKASLFARSAALACVVAIVYLFYIYSTIYCANIHRVEKAREDSVKQSVVEVCQLPYKKYVWCSDVDKEIWAKRFKQFNGIDENIKIISKK
ncbi:MAG: DUF6056 family protein [Eubacterium sp.]